MEKRIKILIAGCLAVSCLLCGCKTKEHTLIVAEAAENSGENGAPAAGQQMAGKAAGDQQTMGEAAGGRQTTDEAAGSRQTAEVGGKVAVAEECEVYVYVCGAVEKPGVYTLRQEPRICDAIDAAGGFTEDAATDYWNLAQKLVDGQMLYVPTAEEAKERDWDALFVQQEPAQEDGKININTADKALLMTIPGIGEAKADSMISYRNTNGSFSDISEVMNIPGIKSGLFEKMKDYITVE